jgi:cytochrome c biogenesis protein CcdA
MLIGAAATASFALRYLVPLIALFAMAASLSAELFLRSLEKSPRAVQTEPRTAATR